MAYDLVPILVAPLSSVIVDMPILSSSNICVMVDTILRWYDMRYSINIDNISISYSFDVTFFTADCMSDSFGTKP